jgi:hypothetical protein
MAPGDSRPPGSRAPGPGHRPRDFLPEVPVHLVESGLGAPRRARLPPQDVEAGRYTVRIRGPPRRERRAASIARRSAESPSLAPPRISSLLTTSAPGQAPEAHHPTAAAGRPAEAATSQNARRRRSVAETGALVTSRRAGPRRRRYHAVPSGGRSPAGDPAGRTRASARTPLREGNSPVARSVQTSGGGAGFAFHQPVAPDARSSRIPVILAGGVVSSARPSTATTTTAARGGCEHVGAARARAR